MRAFANRYPVITAILVGFLVLAIFVIANL
jgi:hypothetical protein